MEIIELILQNTINSFDFGLVAAINILTYCINKIISEVIPSKSTVWNKRIILLCSAIFLGIFYHFINCGDDKLIINSIILSPVSWSWIGKPIMRSLHVDYKK